MISCTHKQYLTLVSYSFGNVSISSGSGEAWSTEIRADECGASGVHTLPHDYARHIERLLRARRQ